MGYVPGEYYMICDVCGFKKRKSQMFRMWNGLMVCRHDWEPRHSQDFVRGKADRQAVPIARPEPTDRFLEVGEITSEDL